MFVQAEATVGSASEQHTDFIKKASICLKLMTIFVTFIVVLVAGGVSKGALIFMLAQAHQLNNKTNPPLKYCPENVLFHTANATYEVIYGEEETIAWLW